MVRESEIEKDYCNQVKKMKGLAIKLTSMAGLPDRLIIIPNDIYFVEFQAPGEKPRPLQQFVINKLRSLGAKVYVIDSFTQLPNISS
jgi:hypothetical protein